MINSIDEGDQKRILKNARSALRKSGVEWSAQASDPKPRPSKILVFVASESGGVRKTWTAMGVRDVIAGMGYRVRYLEIDEKASASELLPDHQPVVMPSPDDLRMNDVVLNERLAVLRTAVKALEPGTAMVVDLGSNLDKSVFEYALRTRLGALLADTTAFVLVPLATGPGQIVAAKRTRERVQLALAGVPVVPVVCGTADAIRRVSPRDAEALKAFSPDIDRGFFIQHPTLPPTAAQALGELERRLSVLASADPQDVESWLGCDDGTGYYLQADYAVAWKYLRESTERCLFFSETGDT